MTQKTKLVTGAIAVLLPILVGVLMVSFINYPQDSVVGLVPVLATIFYAPIILVVGSIVAFFSKNSKSAEKWFTAGFGIPSFLATCAVIYMLLP